LGLAFLSCALLVSRAAPLAIDPEMVYLFGQAKAILSLARAILVVLFFSFTIDLLLPDLSLGAQFLLQCLCAWCLFCFGQLTGNLRMLDVPNFFIDWCGLCYTCCLAHTIMMAFFVWLFNFKRF